MSVEEAAAKPHAEKTLADFLGKYPPKDLPVIYADSAPITWRGGGVVKFYFIRNEPSITADSTTEPQLVAQVVMPAENFAAMVLFFDDEVNAMVRAGTLKPDVVEKTRAFYRDRRAQLDQKDASK
ncbi:MAG: hypothetical protein ACLQFI_11050 [Methylocella sp.]